MGAEKYWMEKQRSWDSKEWERRRTQAVLTMFLKKVEDFVFHSENGIEFIKFLEMLQKLGKEDKG